MPVEVHAGPIESRLRAVTGDEIGGHLFPAGPHRLGNLAQLGEKDLVLPGIGDVGAAVQAEIQVVQPTAVAPLGIHVGYMRLVAERAGINSGPAAPTASTRPAKPQRRRP